MKERRVDALRHDMNALLIEAKYEIYMAKTNPYQK